VSDSFLTEHQHIIGYSVS